jgi:hypothetical protein
MTVVLALVAILVPASVTLVGYWFKQQQQRRLASEREQANRRLSQEHDEEQARLRLDASMRAAELFGPTADESTAAVRAASGLLALTQLDRSDLAIALLVDLWLPREATMDSLETELGKSRAEAAGGVSTETAILVVNAALQSTPSAQLVAAELLCRHAASLDMCQSLHWPRAIDGHWIPRLPSAAKLLIMDALVWMACSSQPSKPALRSLAVRLYYISAGDPSDRVKGCVGTLLTAILPAVRELGYAEFMQGLGTVTIEQMAKAAAKASPNPDGYLEMILEDRSRLLKEWSSRCVPEVLPPGVLATAADRLDVVEDDEATKAVREDQSTPTGHATSRANL